MRASHLRFLFFFSITLVLGSSARAQPPDGSARASAAARALFQEGLACVDRDDWACAEDRFAHARALRASPVIVSNHAIALGHVGRLVEASESFRTVLHDPRAPAELRESARAGIDALAPRIGQLAVHARGATDDVSLFVDGALLDASLVGMPTPSDPGEHVVEARRGEVRVASAHVHVEPGQPASVELVVPAPMVRQPVSPEAAASPTTVAVSPEVLAPTEAVRHDDVVEQWWFWTIVGVVVVGAGVGVTAAVVSSEQTTLPSGSLGVIEVSP